MSLAATAVLMQQIVEHAALLHDQELPYSVKMRLVPALTQAIDVLPQLARAEMDLTFSLLVVKERGEPQ